MFSGPVVGGSSNTYTSSGSHIGPATSPFALYKYATEKKKIDK
jgi:hypothetical protein